MIKLLIILQLNTNNLPLLELGVFMCVRDNKVYVKSVYELCKDFDFSVCYEFTCFSF